jgi:hypothetical protein
LVCVSAGTEAASPPVGARRLDLDADRLMEVALPDGTVLSASMVIYPYRGRWVLPLGQMAEALGIGVTVWSKNRIAEGFVIDESRTFRLDVSKCEVKYDGRTESYPCDEIVEQDDEFYVQDDLLARWFPVALEVSSLLSQVQVRPRELLPAEARKRREREAARLARNGEDDADPGYPREPVPYGWLGFHSLDQQMQLNSNRQFGFGRVFDGNSLVAGEIAGMESSLFGNYTDQALLNWRFTASRRSPDGDLGGGLKLSQISLFDVDLPTIPMITPVQPLRGILLSSYPINDPINWESTDLQGVLPNGWEVLLFRNEIFVERRVGDGSGWYRFNNVPLQYGRNVIKLVFFGPHGERREQYKNFTIDRDQQRSGRRDYRLALGFKPTNGQPALSLQWSESPVQGLTAIAGAYAEQDTGRQFGTVGLVGLTDFALLTGRFAYGFHGGGGHATELGVQSGYGPLAVGAKYTHLDDFQSQLFNPSPAGARLTHQWEGNAFWLLPVGPGFALASELLRRGFDDGTAQAIWRNRLTTHWKGVQLQTQVDWTSAAPRPLFGRTEFFYFPYAFRLRGAVEYDFHRLTTLEVEGQLVRPDRYQLTGNIRWPLDGAPARLLFQASRLFRELSLGTFANAVVDGPMTVGLFAAFSLLREPRTERFSMVRNPQGYTGAVSLLAFEDSNGNGRRDEGERGVAGLQFQMCARNPARTDAAGIAFVSGLRAQFPCDVLAMESADGDPFLRPVRQGIRIVPRAGHTATIDFPMRRVGQIDGFVWIGLGRSQRGKPNAEVELIAVDGTVLATGRTDSEGFYAFEDVGAGATYRVRLRGEWLERSGHVGSPSELAVTVPASGAFIGGQDFRLTAERKPSATRRSNRR